MYVFLDLLNFLDGKWYKIKVLKENSFVRLIVDNGFIFMEGREGGFFSIDIW